MNLLTPTPFTAAPAGAFSAAALPVASRWLGTEADVNVGWVLAFIVLVALPAHAGVLGLRRSSTPASRAVAKPLLMRVGAWLAAAVGVSLVMMAGG